MQEGVGECGRVRNLNLESIDVVIFKGNFELVKNFVSN